MGVQDPQYLAGAPRLADWATTREKAIVRLVRRDALGLVLGGVAAAAVHGRSFARAVTGARRMTKQFPPLELQGTRESVASLGELSGYSIVSGGSATFAVWLKSKDGAVRYMGVDEREPLPMFEVFTLALATMAELEARWRAWKPAVVPVGTPELFRSMMTTRPAEPKAPTAFEPWPFDHWTTKVLRRAEFIVEDVPVGPTFGNNPNVQSAARPMSVPKAASASCEVVAGILFSSPDGKRLLMGADWMPAKMVVTTNASKIVDYLATCEAVDLPAYLQRISRRS